MDASMGTATCGLQKVLLQRGRGRERLEAEAHTNQGGHARLPIPPIHVTFFECKPHISVTCLVYSGKEFQSMRVITVCVGSACHLKGSHEIINYFKEAIAEAGLDGKVELKGTFCMDQCTDGANLLIDEQIFHANSVDEARQIFQTEILQKLK